MPRTCSGNSTRSPHQQGATGKAQATCAKSGWVRRKMVRKAKVYGKQKTNELVSAIQNLNLTTPPKGPCIDIQNFHALAPVTGNKCRAGRVEYDELDDGSAGAGNTIEEPNPESKLTHQPRLPRAFVSTAKRKQLFSVKKGKQKLTIK